MFNSNQVTKISIKNGYPNIALIMVSPSELLEYAELIAKSNSIVNLEIRFARIQYKHEKNIDQYLEECFKLIASCSSLKAISLYNCQITAEGLATIIKCTPQCERYKFVANDLKKAVSNGLPLLAKAIEGASSLRSIIISGYMKDMGDVNAIRKAVLKNKSIVRSDITPFDRSIYVSEAFEESDREFKIKVYLRDTLRNIFIAETYEPLFAWGDCRLSALYLHNHPEIVELREELDIKYALEFLLKKMTLFATASQIEMSMKLFAHCCENQNFMTTLPEELKTLANYKPRHMTASIAELAYAGKVEEMVFYIRELNDFSDYASDASSVDSEDGDEYKWNADFAEYEIPEMTEEELGELEGLNKNLENTDLLETKEINGRFCFSFSRGIHYLTNRMSPEVRRSYREDTLVGKHVLSSAAIDSLKTTPAMLKTVSPIAQRRAGEAVRKQVVDLEEGKEVSPIETKSELSPLKHTNPRDALQQRYSNGYDIFHSYMKKNAGKKGHFLEHFISDCNPYVSCSDYGKHPIKYALGHKAFGEEDKKLVPHYRYASGKPLFPYLGKIYLIIMGLSDLNRLSPAFVLNLHAQFKITVSTHFSNNILTEREVSFPGFIEGEYVKFELAARVPSFEAYKPYYLNKYGLTERQFKRFRSNILSTKLNSKSREVELGKLYDHLSGYYAILLEKYAHQFVRSKDALLLYKALNDSYSSTPSDPEQAKRLNKTLRESEPEIQDPFLEP